MAPNPPSPFSASFDARCGSSEPEELPSTQHHAVQSLPSERSTRSSSYPRFGRSSGPKTQNPKGNSLPRALSRLRSHPPNPAPAQVSIKEHVYATLSFPRSRNQSRPTIHDGPPRGYPMNSLWHQDVNVWQDSNHASSLGRKTNGNAVPITGSLQYSGRLTPGYATPIPSGRDPDEDEIPGSGWSTKELESTLCFGRIPGRSRRVEWNEDPPERFEYGHRSRRENLHDPFSTHTSLQEPYDPFHLSLSDDFEDESDDIIDEHNGRNYPDHPQKKSAQKPPKPPITVAQRAIREWDSRKRFNYLSSRVSSRELKHPGYIPSPLGPKIGRR